MADDGSFKVDLEHLDTVTARIAGLVGFVEDSLAGLDARIAATHQNWTGKAATAHAAAHTEWMTAATEVREGVEEMRAAAVAAHSHYNDAVAANLHMLKR
ncbi:WXG100 family type VII secretion target [Nocardia sp. FBN12]|uniref:WXG100 family type VII secretion target n=1 Tax=Nocardia sp. FBN12 TaxID=3419766 RepID=UPI003D05D7EF